MSPRTIDRVAAVFREVLNVGPDRDPREAVPGDDWAWDSLAHVSLVAALESEFGVSIDLDASLAMTSFPAAVATLAEAGVTFPEEEAS
jgi:acyl carrier protein